MLSNITNYLFGGQGSATNEKENVNFHEVEDDDWMVVDKLAEKQNDENDDDLIVSSQTYINLTASYLKAETQSSRPPVPDKSTRRRSISCKRLVNRRCSTPLRELSPACANAKALAPCLPKKGSRSSSKSSSHGIEESWYITPPPCFVSSPYQTKPSSLENLLIEQPGITLRDISAFNLQLPDEEEVFQPETTSKQKRNNKTAPKEKENAQSDDKRRLLLEAHEQKKIISTYQSQINSAQKVEQKIPNQFSKRNQMDRLNKVQYELSSRKKRQRRADLNKKHSGVNNNRKCCY